MTSPCSVSFSRPPTDPPASARIARLAGPPPRPIAPPRPWNSVSSTPRSRATPVSAAWARCSSQLARLLVRIGVAEHDLLAVTAGPEMATVGRVGQDRAEDLGRRLERRRVLEQRDDVEDRRRATAARRGLGQPEDSEDVVAAR